MSVTLLEKICLLSHVTQKAKEFFLAHPNYQLSLSEQKMFSDLLTRAEQGEPLAYLLGKKEFWSRDFYVTRDVLIPRPETEHLIEYCLSYFKKENLKVLDLGTGSGIIAITLKKEKPSWILYASDLSKASLNLAQKNADFHNTLIHFYQSDWFKQIPPDLKFDVIVSNPPYIAEHDPHLLELKFEPLPALMAAENGTAAIKEIIVEAKKFLHSAGILIIEHGWDQADAIQTLLIQENYTIVLLGKDLANHARFVVAQSK